MLYDVTLCTMLTVLRFCPLNITSYCALSSLIMTLWDKNWRTLFIWYPFVEKDLEVIIEWVYFKERASKGLFYSILFNSIQSITRSGPCIPFSQIHDMNYFCLSMIELQQTSNCSFLPRICLSLLFYIIIICMPIYNTLYTCLYW